MTDLHLKGHPDPESNVYPFQFSAIDYMEQQ